MDKTKIFMVVTAIISMICFNFNKLLHIVLSTICDNIYDTSVPVYGPYMRVKPIRLQLATIDNEICTNKMELLLNWYWDTDIGGITTSNILMQGRVVSLQYTKKFSDNPTKVYKCIIDTEDQKIIINSVGDDILFEELKFI